MKTSALRPGKMGGNSACVTLVSAFAPRRLFSGRTLADIWQSNFGLVLAVVTLVALLVGWIGGSLTEFLPRWAVLTAAFVAFAAGGYTGLTGAIEQARERTLDIDFLMIAVALGAAAIGEWEEGALLLFLFTLSGALEEFAMDRTRRAIEAPSHASPIHRLAWPKDPRNHHIEEAWPQHCDNSQRQ